MPAQLRVMALSPSLVVPMKTYSSQFTHLACAQVTADIDLDRNYEKVLNEIGEIVAYERT